MRLVIIESPYAGDTTRNVAYARACMADCLSRGEAPIASHLLYTQPGVLDDNVPEQRTLGIDAGLAWGERADAAVFYVDLGMSPGMGEAWERHFQEGLAIEMRRLEGWGWEKRGWMAADVVDSSRVKPLTGLQHLVLDAATGTSGSGSRHAPTISHAVVASAATPGWMAYEEASAALSDAQCAQLLSVFKGALPEKRGGEFTLPDMADNPTDAELLVREWGLGE